METSSTYSDWFAQAFKALDVTPNEVAVKLGINNVKLYNIVNGKAKPGYETIQEILMAYPRLNANWLLKGQKPILHESSAVIIGPGNQLTSNISLPLYEAGNGYTISEETYSLPVLEEQAATYSSAVIIRLIDNSMLPKYPAGMRLLAKPVPVAELDYINSMLVMILYRSTLVVRRIKENDLIGKGYLTLYADSDAAGYVLVRRDDIKSIWQVVDIIGVESLP